MIENIIRRNQETFLKMEQDVLAGPDLASRLNKAQEATFFAVNHTTDIFSSEIIEDIFLEYAKYLKANLSSSFEQNTVLHVMTEASVIGGHTRVVERWIQQFPEQKHSCIIFNQLTKLPEQLKKIVEASGGELVLWDRNDTLGWTLIRMYASNFEYIVLHTHMWDPIPLIVFGTEDFKRPIILFNHANHIFWLGVSIADHVADLFQWDHELTLKYRGAMNSSVLGIPADDSELLSVDEITARKKLGIPLSKKIIFSGGSASKYNSAESISFYNIVSDIIKRDRDVIFYIASGDSNNIFWPRLKKEFPDNLFFTGYLDYKTEYPFYLASADLVIDSYPVGGGTFVIDAIKAQKPVLVYNNKLQSDFIVNSPAFCEDYSKFLQKVHMALDNPEYRDKLYNEIYQKYIEYTDNQQWRRRVLKIMESLPKEHKIYKFKRQIPPKITDCSLKTLLWTDPSALENSDK